MSGVNGSAELEGLIPRMNRGIFERIAVRVSISIHLEHCLSLDVFSHPIHFHRKKRHRMPMSSS